MVFCDLGIYCTMKKKKDILYFLEHLYAICTPLTSTYPFLDGIMFQTFVFG